MKFAQPCWLIIGFAACAFLLWRYRQFNRRQRADLASFVAPRLMDRLTASFSPGRRRLKQGLFIAGVAFLCLALARPQAGYRWEEAHRRGLDILVAVDTSKSMLTEDVKPNRLGRAKLAVDDLVNKLNGDGVGLLAFAGDAFLQCPITLDYDAFRESVDALDTGVISRGGTDIGGAIREADADFKGRPATDKILVLITDGEDLGGDAVAAAREAAKDGVKIFTVGVGTAAGELIPVPGDNGGTEFLRDSDGNYVKSHLDATTLKQIAEVSGGMYEPLGQEGQGLTEIYDHGLGKFTRHDLAARRTKVYLEQFQWPLLAALFCFTGEMLIGTRKRQTKNSSAPLPAAKAAVVAAALALLAWPATSRASVASAETSYHQGKFSQAEKEYAATAAKEPKKAQLQFNLGSAAYKSGDFDKAALAFQNTLHTTDVPVQQSAYYNLGDAQYRIGQKTEQSNPQDTIKSWQGAVKSYEAALQLKPDDVDAKYNRDFVKKKLEQLKKQQQQNQQHQQNKNQQNKDEQSKSGQGQHQKDEKGQKNNQNQESQQQANAGSKGDQNKTEQSKQNSGSSQPQPNQPPQNQPANQSPQNQPNEVADNQPSRPGEMSKEEAKQLLDSLKNGEQKLPPTQFARGPVKPQDDQPLKDW